jgi:16S rRNA (guanine966-N2)-methyltransferase
MRIIAGRFKGLRLPSPRDRCLRPTTDRVREALFSALGNAVVEARILDLFAGTGALGFEALSRGAAFAVLVERDRQIARLLSSTAQALGAKDQVSILAMDASEAIPHLKTRGDTFGIVFLDPPYGTDCLGSVMVDRAFPDLVESEGVLIIERSIREPEPEAPEVFRKASTKRYGDTVVEFFHKS